MLEESRKAVGRRPEALERDAETGRGTGLKNRGNRPEKTGWKISYR